MEHRRIGSLSVSVVGLGCNNFGGRVDESRTAAVVHAALDAGVDFFDTADVYGGTRSEEFLGRALKGRRDRVVIATKFGMPAAGPGPIDPERRGGAAPAYIRRAIEDSLRRLGTDRIDLYQLHRPDPEVPVADTLGALDDLVRAGKVREIGCSNFDAAQIRAAHAAAPGARFASAQDEYSLLRRDAEQGVLPACAERGLAFLPYFPLASGLLTGKYRRGEPPPEGARIQAGARWLSERNLAVVEALRAFAEGRGRTLLELAVSWLASGPRITSVIAGATTPEQVRANVLAAGWPLSEAERAEVSRLAA
jgi:aryl-alcohol dehydrogenase-like predicted oxidoreductase